MNVFKNIPMNLNRSQRRALDDLSKFLYEWIKRTSIEDFIKLKEEVGDE